MDENEFKQRLLQLIWNDYDVRSAIVNVNADGVHGQEIEKLNQEIEELQTEISRLNREKETLQEELDNKIFKCSELAREKECLHENLDHTLTEYVEMKCQNKKLRETLDEERREIDKLTGENQKYKERYSEIDAVYDIFSGLDENVRSSFAQIVNYDSPETFLTSGAEQENIRLYWEKVSMEYQKYDDYTLNVLNEVFDYLFEQFRRSHSGYRRIRTKTGENFSLDTHTRTPDSLPSGKVKSVIIDGYMNDNGTKKVKSFVKIG